MNNNQSSCWTIAILCVHGDTSQPQERTIIVTSVRGLIPTLWETTCCSRHRAGLSGPLGGGSVALSPYLRDVPSRAQLDATQHVQIGNGNTNRHGTVWLGASANGKVPLPSEMMNHFQGWVLFRRQCISNVMGWALGLHLFFIHAFVSLVSLSDSPRQRHD